MIIIHWLKSIRKIKFGNQFWNSILIWSVLVFLFLSCVKSSKTNIEKSDDYKNSTLLNSQFYAVGIVYHRFGDNRYPSTNTGIVEFEEHLKYLNTHKFKSYTASEVVKSPYDTIKKVVITIDDGFKSFYKNGWPLLRDYKCKATIFINTQSVGWNDYLSWAEIRNLHHNGIEIGAHSHRHSYFLNTKDSLKEEYFLQDMMESERLFKDSLGFVPKVYAYPYGEFDEEMASILQSRGYDLAFAQNSGVWCSENSLFAIPRFSMSGKHVSLKQFIQKVNMKPLKMKRNNKFPDQVNGGERFEFTMYLDSLSNYQGLNCFFNNELRNEFMTINKDTVLVKITMPVNKRRAIFTITAKDKNNQWYWWSHLFVNVEENE